MIIIEMKCIEGTTPLSHSSEKHKRDNPYRKGYKVYTNIITITAL